MHTLTHFFAHPPFRSLWQSDVNNAIKELTSRVNALQASLKKKKDSKKEAELKKLTKAMFDAQAEKDGLEGKTGDLMRRKTDLSNKLQAKRASLEKYRRHEL